MGLSILCDLAISFKYAIRTAGKSFYLTETFWPSAAEDSMIRHLETFTSALELVRLV